MSRAAGDVCPSRQGWRSECSLCAVICSKAKENTSCGNWIFHSQVLGTRCEV